MDFFISLLKQQQQQQQQQQQNNATKTISTIKHSNLTVILISRSVNDME